MRTFKQYVEFREQQEFGQDQQQVLQQSEQFVQQLETQIKQISDPKNVEKIVTSFNPNSIDDLIQKLKNSPQVRNFEKAYEQAKSQQNVQQEGILGSMGNMVGGFFQGVGKLIWGAFSKLAGVVNWALTSIPKSIWRTMKPLVPFARDEGGGQIGGWYQKFAYASSLLLIFGGSAFLLGATGPLWAAGVIWFGFTVLDPILRKTDGGGAFAMA